MRQAAAEARRHLLELAAARLDAPLDRLDVSDGCVTVRGTDRRTTYWQLLGGRRFERAATGTVASKRAEDYRIVGRAGRRIDLVGLVTGTARYVQDLVRPGMLHARVVRPPSPRAPARERRRRGRARHARRRRRGARRQLPRSGRGTRGGGCARDGSAPRPRAVAGGGDPAARGRSPALAPRAAVQALPGGRRRGRRRPIPPIATPAAAVRTLAARYTRPYLMHGSIGPSAALAEWRDGA